MAELGSTTTAGMPDGPLRPNRVLDRASRLAACAAPDNLVWQDDHLLFTSGRAVLLLDGTDGCDREAEEILRFESDVTAMAAAKDGSLAVGLSCGAIVIVGGEHDGRTIAEITGGAPVVPTALCFADPDTLFAGMAWLSDTRDVGPPSPVARRADGSLWRLDLRGGEPVCLAGQLDHPSGLLLRSMDRLLVSEGGRCRLLECSTRTPRAPQVVCDGLPGHPARPAPGMAGSIWLPIFALCPQRGRPAPDPWPQPCSLVMRLDAGLAPTASLHGAGDGRARGTVSCLEARGDLIVACRADNVLLAVHLLHQPET